MPLLLILAPVHGDRERGHDRVPRLANLISLPLLENFVVAPFPYVRSGIPTFRLMNSVVFRTIQMMEV